MVGKLRASQQGWLAAGIIGIASTAALAADQPAAYGGYTNALDQFFWSGGGIVWFIQFPLSIVMVSLAVHYALVIRRGTMVPDDVQQEVHALVEQRQYREALEFTAAEPSMFSHVVHYSLTAASGGYNAMRKAMDEAVEERTTKLLRKVEYMNMIGAVSPMIGLFGTTYGIILALNELVLARGTPEPAQLAGAISTALVCTFWGLMTAIPALMLFAIFRNRVDGLAAECALAVEDLLGMIQPIGSRSAAGPQSKPAASAPAKAEAGAARPPAAQRLDEAGA
jgi:biopolymer transport protein ExbB